MGQRASVVKPRDLIVCDHCEYVTQCDLSGPDDSTCPHHYELYTEEARIMTIEIAEEANRIVTIQTPEREITVLLTEEDFRIMEYAAYQLEISVESYIQTMFRLEIREIKRKYEI